MSEVNMFQYVSLVTGIIGTITGIIGGATGYVAYRRTNNLKSLDLRLELKKTINNAYVALEESLELLEVAEKSRTRVASALGKMKSGEMKEWASNISYDKKRIEKMVVEIPFPIENYDEDTAIELENKIVKIHASLTRAASIVAKYTKEIAKDDADRVFIREQAHSRL